MTKKVHMSVRHDLETSQNLEAKADMLSVDKSTLVRWIVEAWLNTVDDEDDPPSLPAVTALARNYNKGIKERHKK